MGTGARWGLKAGLIGAGTSVVLAIGLSSAPVVPLTTGVVSAIPPSAASSSASAPTIYEPAIEPSQPVPTVTSVSSQPAPAPAPAAAAPAPAVGSSASGGASSAPAAPAPQPEPAIGAPAGSRYGPTGYPTPSAS